MSDRNEQLKEINSDKLKPPVNCYTGGVSTTPLTSPSPQVLYESGRGDYSAGDFTGYVESDIDTHTTQSIHGQYSPNTLMKSTTLHDSTSKSNQKQRCHFIKKECTPIALDNKKSRMNCKYLKNNRIVIEEDLMVPKYHTNNNCKQQTTNADMNTIPTQILYDCNSYNNKYPYRYCMEIPLIKTQINDEIDDPTDILSDEYNEDISDETTEKVEKYPVRYCYCNDSNSNSRRFCQSTVPPPIFNHRISHTNKPELYTEEIIHHPNSIALTNATAKMIKCHHHYPGAISNKKHSSAIPIVGNVLLAPSGSPIIFKQYPCMTSIRPSNKVKGRTNKLKYPIATNKRYENDIMNDMSGKYIVDLSPEYLAPSKSTRKKQRKLHLTTREPIQCRPHIIQTTHPSTITSVPLTTFTNGVESKQAALLEQRQQEHLIPVEEDGNIVECDTLSPPTLTLLPSYNSSKMPHLIPLHRHRRPKQRHLTSLPRVLAPSKYFRRNTNNISMTHPFASTQKNTYLEIDCNDCITSSTALYKPESINICYNLPQNEFLYCNQTESGQPILNNRTFSNENTRLKYANRRKTTTTTLSHRPNSSNNIFHLQKLARVGNENQNKINNKESNDYNFDENLLFHTETENMAPQKHRLTKNKLSLKQTKRYIFPSVDLKNESNLDKLLTQFENAFEKDHITTSKENMLRKKSNLNIITMKSHQSLNKHNSKKIKRKESYNKIKQSDSITSEPQTVNEEMCEQNQPCKSSSSTDKNDKKSSQDSLKNSELFRFNENQNSADNNQKEYLEINDPIQGPTDSIDQLLKGFVTSDNVNNNDNATIINDYNFESTEIKLENSKSFDICMTIHNNVNDYMDNNSSTKTNISSNDNIKKDLNKKNSVSQHVDLQTKPTKECPMDVFSDNVNKNEMIPTVYEILNNGIENKYTKTNSKINLIEKNSKQMTALLSHCTSKQKFIDNELVKSAATQIPSPSNTADKIHMCSTDTEQCEMEIDLRHSKSYIVNLIDRVLSKELGTVTEDKIRSNIKSPMLNSKLKKNLKLNDNIVKVKSAPNNYLNNNFQMRTFLTKSTVESNVLNTTIQEEPHYIKQLKEMRWGHLKHIQYEIKQLEDLERFLDSCSSTTNSFFENNNLKK